MMYRTPLRKLDDRTWVRAEFGLHTIGSQAPYMSLTGEVYGAPAATERNLIACGQCHKDVLEAFPELAELAKWHMVSDGVPMHYLANARFWWEAANYVRPMEPHDPDPTEAFLSTIAWGVLKSDGLVLAIAPTSWPAVEAKLKARVPKMRRAYRKLVKSLPDLARGLGAVCKLTGNG